MLEVQGINAERARFVTGKVGPLRADILEKDLWTLSQSSTEVLRVAQDDRVELGYELALRGDVLGDHFFVVGQDFFAEFASLLAIGTLRGRIAASLDGRLQAR